MPYNKATGLNKAGTKARRRRPRASTVTKTKYQRPTAKNQKYQILSNAKKIAYLSKITKAQRLFCDWQFSSDIFGDIDPAGNFTTFWGIRSLMDFPSWRPVLRTSEAVEVAAKTYMSRMQLNMRYTLNAADWAQITIFIVTPRKYATSQTPLTVPPVKGQGYIENTQSFNPRLNPAMYKVHYCRNLTLTKNAFPTPAVGIVDVGNPSTTWAKGQINLPLKFTVRSPYTLGYVPPPAPPNAPDNEWKTLRDVNLPYYQRYFLMAYITQRAPQGTAVNGGARISYDMLSTTINFD